MRSLRIIARIIARRIDAIAWPALVWLLSRPHRPPTDPARKP